MKIWRWVGLTLVLEILLMGCSGVSGDVVTPGQKEIQTAPNTACLGLWQVRIDAETGEVDITQLRYGNMILNVLQFLEPPVFSNLTIDFDTLKIKPAQKYVGVDVILKHPFNPSKYMGFDVRGVVFGPEVTNADGLTVALSPEFFSGVIFGYIDGLLGVPNSVAGYTGLGGYKYFCRDIGLNDTLEDFFADPGNIVNRGVFPSGTQISRHYDLSWKNTEPPVNFFVFNYAVYANYHLPGGTPPYDIDDFDITKANSAEAFCASVTEMSNTLWYFNGNGGGHISLEIEVWDWQGDIAEVIIESAGVIVITTGAYIGPGSTNKSFIYSFNSVPGAPITVGELDILITATDVKTFGQSWFMNVLPTDNPMYDIPVYNCWIHTTQVSDTPGPCENMEPFETYDAYVISGDPWTYLLPEDAGVTCTRGSLTAPYIISAVLRYYPVTFNTFGASLADSPDPLVPDVHYSSPYWITADIACDTNNNIYLVKNNEPDPPDTLVKTYFDGSSFTEPVEEHTFKDTIVRITVDDEDNPVVLVKSESDDVYKIHHKSGDIWNQYPVNNTIAKAGIKDFDFNPVQDHYVFVCSVTAIRMFVQDNASNIVFTDDELFGTLPFTMTPSIYIDQDNPDCRIVVWGTFDSASSYARPVVRYAAIDYTIPKVMGNLTSSENGPSVVGGAWAPGTDYMFVPAYDADYNQALGRLTIPSDW